MARPKDSKKGAVALPTDPTERFRKQAGVRVNQALVKITLVGKCANSKNEWTPAQIQFIKEKLDVAVKDAVRRFEIEPEKKAPTKIEIPA